MAKHLTDKQRKQIIADYATLGNYSEVARKHNVSRTTVKTVVMADTESFEKFHQKKEQNTADILKFMENQKENVCNIISLYLSALQDSERLDRASVQSIATSLGIVIDKFTGTAAELEKLKAEIAKLRGEQKQQEINPLVSDLVDAIKKREKKDHAE